MNYYMYSEYDTVDEQHTTIVPGVQVVQYSNTRYRLMPHVIDSPLSTLHSTGSTWYQ